MGFDFHTLYKIHLLLVEMVKCHSTNNNRASLIENKMLPLEFHSAVNEFFRRVPKWRRGNV